MGYVLKTVKCYWRIAGIRGIVVYLLSKVSKNLVKQKIRTVDSGNMKSPIFLRIPSSDFLTYWQVFVDKEYKVKINREPRVIVDAGANIGLASIYFATLFPNSTITALEPENSNFEILKQNTAPYKNIVTMHAALWNENRRINIVDPGLGYSGFMTESGSENHKKLGELVHCIEGMTIDRIMEKQGIEYIDLLKMDIEGAEREVFLTSSTWIQNVGSLIVELHERKKPGCSRSFYIAIDDFDEKWIQGENVFVSRRNGCLAPM
jgi:FkbM family methyltransferase